MSKEKNKGGTSETNYGIQSRGLFNKNIQTTINNYADEKVIGKLIDDQTTVLIKEIRDGGKQVTQQVKEDVQDIVRESVFAAIFNIDEGRIKTEAEMKVAMQGQIAALQSHLSDQITQKYRIYVAEAEKHNKVITDMFAEWKSESEYYAQRAYDTFIKIDFTYNSLSAAHASAEQNFAFGRKLLSDGKFVKASQKFDFVLNNGAASAGIEWQVRFYKSLADCHIQLMWDSSVGREMPLIHDVTMAHLSSDENYIQAVANEQDIDRKGHYIKCAEHVEKILREYDIIQKLNDDGKYNYDCFICVKQSQIGEKEEHTADFEWLTEKKIFDKLNSAGVKTFLADKTLKTDLPVEKGSDDYSAFILYALQKAKCMLLVLSNADYAQTQWVRYEFSCFMSYHNHPQIVVLCDGGNVEIAGVTDKQTSQTLDYNSIDVKKIVGCVKEKVEHAKGYVDEDYMYCEACGSKNPAAYKSCIQVQNGKVCGGRLITAAEHANRFNEKLCAENERQRAENENLRLELEKALKEKEAAEEQVRRTAEDSNTDYYENMVDWRYFIVNDTGEVFVSDRYYINIEFPYGTTKIDDEAFDCSNIDDEYHFESINIPSTVMSIGYAAFRSNYYLKTVSFAANSRLTSIDDSAFEGCGITSIDIPDSVTNIGVRAFAECGQITRITIPNNIVNIGVGAFDGCDSLQYNEFDNALYLGSNANPYLILIKAKDTSITSCIIHSETKFISSHAFDDCDSLQYNEFDNALYLGSNANPYLILVKAKNTSITTCVIHSETVLIHDNAFDDCDSLMNIVIPNSVSVIGDGAFGGCESLNSIILSERLNSIGAYAFYGCSSLESIIIPNSVTYISDGTFDHCNRLKSIHFMGSKGQWEHITYNYWISYPLIIHCLDGDIEKK